MASEKYRRFLEVESKKAPIERKQSDVKGRLWVSWGESTDRVVIERGSSDIIDSIYFGEELSKTVVMDRKVARIIQERLKGLEEENLRLYKQARIMKIAICGLIVIIFIMAVIVTFS
ncbi:MAG: hypothetical protein QXK89_02185 [Candidatus Bathyarchaeia archaeon]|nr:hypothetical protein [Candidatus Bathyarchaeota archaeon]